MKTKLTALVFAVALIAMLSFSTTAAPTESPHMTATETAQQAAMAKQEKIETTDVTIKTIASTNTAITIGRSADVAMDNNGKTMVTTVGARDKIGAERIRPPIANATNSFNDAAGNPNRGNWKAEDERSNTDRSPT